MVYNVCSILEAWVVQVILIGTLASVFDNPTDVCMKIAVIISWGNFFMSSPIIGRFYVTFSMT